MNEFTKFIEDKVYQLEYNDILDAMRYLTHKDLQDLLIIAFNEYMFSDCTKISDFKEKANLKIVNKMLNTNLKKEK